MHPVYLDNGAFSVKVDGEDDEEDDLEDEGWACHRVEDCGPLAQPGFWKHCMLIGENKKDLSLKGECHEITTYISFHLRL